MSAPYYSDDMVTLLHGNALALAATLEPESVQTIVTSPPYFGLRDYGESEQFGSEDSVEDFVAHLVDLFTTLRPALTDDGTLWLNLGDSYAGSNKGSWGDAEGAEGYREKTKNDFIPVRSSTTGKTTDGLKAKDLIGIPWRVALALQADGWYLRSDIIWAKPNPMPESVTDRPTKSHEYLFLLAKSPKYYYDADAIREPDSGQDHRRSVLGAQASLEPSGGLRSGHKGIRSADGRNGEGRNKRTVWEVATVPFPGSHFAVYPPELIRPCILAGSRPGDTVLDPFSGSGTTGMVATQEGRKYIGMDLNKDYLDLSLRSRFAQPVLNLGVPA